MGEVGKLTQQGEDYKVTQEKYQRIDIKITRLEPQKSHKPLKLHLADGC